LVTRHRADLLSLIAGLTVLGLGLLLLTGGVGDLALNWVGPGVAIGLGLLIVAAARSNRGSSDDAQAPGDES
jgi:hypothetical protein